MSLRKNHGEDEFNPIDLVSDEDSIEAQTHRRHVRRAIEERLERKRLRKEIDELDDDFDWDEDR